MNPTIIFQFTNTCILDHWNIVNDAVMGGKSYATLKVNPKGNGSFKGHVSLENNGGFSSVKHRFNPIETGKYSRIILKIKGDGKTYQFRMKNKSTDRHSYITHFNTEEDWQVIELALSDMYPSFRGNKLDLPNYNCKSFEEISFLIANKKNEGFELEISTISIQ